jgi:DNA primase
MIPDDVVEEVRAAADIVDVIGEFVPLKKAGREFKANCPFHEERTPSFFVVPAKAMYHCFGCGEHGDVFTFVRKRLGLDFVEAVKHVAQRTGIPVREIRSGRSDDPLRPLREDMAFARDFFLDRLWSWKGGEPARRYLEARGIRRETAERFGLGFSPPEWRALREAAGKHGLEDELLEEVGLLVRGEKRDAPYDRFRGRLMFPIEDVAGRVVAFGGRVMPGVTAGGGKGKYVNSPETPLYHKGRILYGLSWAKNAIRREQSVLVVEGYMDVVSVASAGVENVVAASGTSLTEEQAELLKRYSKQVYLLFDSDRAGLRATFRAGDTLLAEGLHPSVVTLPPSEDPDSVVREQGAEGLRAYVGDAVDILDRKLQILEEHDYFSSIERTRNAVDRLLPTVRAARDPTLRDIYVAKVADKTRVRREPLEAELLREVATRRSDPTSGVGRTGSRARGPGGLPRWILSGDLRSDGARSRAHAPSGSDGFGGGSAPRRPALGPGGTLPRRAGLSGLDSSPEARQPRRRGPRVGEAPGRRGVVRGEAAPAQGNAGSPGFDPRRTRLASDPTPGPRAKAVSYGRQPVSRHQK